MEPGSHLKGLLQTQLASDSSAIRYLPYCLSTLTAGCFSPSSHLMKWTTRILALLHSKEPGARWAGLCLAYRTALLSQKVMIDSSQSWITVTLPMLSRSEPPPTLKAALRLLRVIFTTAVDIPEFHRQVCVPSVIKFTSTVISLADNQPDLELNIICMETLTRIVSLYPTAHRASSASLSTLSLLYLNGSVMGPTNRKLLEAASQLYSVLPLTGGKVGAVNLWRKSVDETLAFGWEAFHCLRTTFLIVQNIARPVPSAEPQVAILLNHDRLRCSVITLQSLVNTVIRRPVQIPLGNLVKFIVGLLSCSSDDKIDGFIDPSIRAIEIAMIPDIWTLGCDLLASIAEQFPYRLDPHSGRLFSILAFQLDQKPNTRQRLYFLKALDSLLKNCHLRDSSILPTRLAKAVLPAITKILSSSSGGDAGESEPSSSKNKNGKKRARNYEGDEVFNTIRQVIYPTSEEGEVLLISLDIIQSLFKNPNISSTMQSIIARIVISILLSLPRMSPSSLSQDPGFLQVVHHKMQKFSVTIGSGTTSVMSKTLPFAIEAALTSSRPEMQRDIGMLLHPRVPPLVRSMPHVEALSLFQAEESQEEAATLSSLEITSNLHVHKNDMQRDVIMQDNISSIPSISAVQEKVPTAEPKQTPKINLPPPLTNQPIYSPNQLPHDAEEEEVGQTANLSPASKFTTIVGSSNDPGTTSKSSLPVGVPPRKDEDEDEDEEMPAIDMKSDSEVEED